MNGFVWPKCFLGAREAPWHSWRRFAAPAIEAAGGDPAHAIMTGDSKTATLTAINAGLPSTGVDFGYTDVPARELGATRVISHFEELLPAIEAVRASAFQRMG